MNPLHLIKFLWRHIVIYIYLTTFEINTPYWITVGTVHSIYKDHVVHFTSVCGKNCKMNLNWAVGLLIAAVGNVVTPQNNDVYECPEPDCTRRFMSTSGRRKHFKKAHQGIRKSCKHSCGKTYSSNEKVELHERTCERNPNRLNR